MSCSGCGFAAPPDFAFCPKCGARLGPAPAAPAPVPQAARPEPLPSGGGAADADRRPVSVLFADLAGFTALGEELDP
jgi:hypothetical protein